MRLPITRPAIANIAVGAQALLHNDTGEDNIAIGLNALLTNVSGDSNTACGFAALGGNTGSGNIAMGFGAGGQLTTGNFNIDIGNPGVAGETTTIRIAKGRKQKRLSPGSLGPTSQARQLLWIRMASLAFQLPRSDLRKLLNRWTKPARQS